jgi:hypothetical protein
MPIRIQCDVPFGGESIPFGDLAAFVQQAEAAGADAGTPVLAVTVPQDDAIIDCFQIEIDDPVARNVSGLFVHLERTEVADAIDVLEAIEDNEGDARMQLAAVRALRQRLTKLAIEQ